MFRPCSNPELRVFSQAIRLLHWSSHSFAARIFLIALVPGVMLFSTWAATAQPTGEIGSCLTGYLFAPGPIVNGHHRQPTQVEIDERTLALWTSRASAGSCR
jgi:hypothetical protein